MPSRIISTPLGAIETEVIGPASGSPVLILHGSPSGIDGAAAMGRFLLEARPDEDGNSSCRPANAFRLILVSRPGYLMTPLDLHDTSIDHEADLFSSLLEVLGIPRVGVLAWSGGGPSAFRLAVRHPYRVTSIVAVACVTQPLRIEWSALQRFLFLTRVGNSILEWASQRMPDRIVRMALASEGAVQDEELEALSRHVLEHPAQKNLIVETAQTMGAARSGPRGPGFENDAKNFETLADLHLNAITCPVLLVHGDSDTDCPPEHSRVAAQILPNCRLVEMKNGSHLAFYAHVDAEDVQGEAMRWLLQQ